MPGPPQDPKEEESQELAANTELFRELSLLSQPELRRLLESELAILKDRMRDDVERHASRTEARVLSSVTPSLRQSQSRISTVVRRFRNLAVIAAIGIIGLVVVTVILYFNSNRRLVELNGKQETLARNQATANQEVSRLNDRTVAAFKGVEEHQKDIENIKASSKKVLASTRIDNITLSEILEVLKQAETAWGNLVLEKGVELRNISDKLPKLKAEVASIQKRANANENALDQSKMVQLLKRIKALESQLARLKRQMRGPVSAPRPRDYRDKN